MSAGDEGGGGLDPAKYTSDGPTGAPDDPEAAHIYGPWFPGAPNNLVATVIPRILVPPTLSGVQVVGPDPTVEGTLQVPSTRSFDPAVATWSRWKKAEERPDAVDATRRGCTAPTPGLTHTVAHPLVAPSPPPQTSVGPVIATSLKLAGLTQFAVEASKFFWYRGEKLPTKFPVVHALIDTTGADVMLGYKAGYRRDAPSACFVHTTDGTLTTDAMRVRTAFTKKIKVGQSGAAAHIIVNPSGHVYQVFDLAKLVAHVQGADGEYNLASVSVEFMVPGPAKDAASYARRLEEGPWPAQAPWVWLYSKSEDASTTYSRSSGRPYAFGPTSAQKAAFQRIAEAFTSFGWFSPGAVPRPRSEPNTAVRTVDPDLALRWFRKREWTYFHHAQVERNRSDAGGLDIPELLGLPLS